MSGLSIVILYIKTVSKASDLVVSESEANHIDGSDGSDGSDGRSVFKFV